jgi:hypothetical protein
MNSDLELDGFDFEDEEMFTDMEWEDEAEGDPFFGPALKSLLSRVPWKRLAQGAVRSITGAGSREGDWEDFEDFEDFEGGLFEGSALGEGEYEAEDVAEMEYLAEMAASAESDAEADAFIGALLPLATKILPKAFSLGRKILPKLIGGARRLTRTLRTTPAGRQLVRTVPTIARNTARQLLQKVGNGQPVTGKVAVQTLAKNAARVLRDPRAAHHCVYRSRLHALRASQGRPMSPPRPNPYHPYHRYHPYHPNYPNYPHHPHHPHRQPTPGRWVF